MITPESRLTDDQLLARHQEAQAWMRDAAAVDGLAQVPESAQSLSFLREHAVLGVVYDTSIAIRSLWAEDSGQPEAPVLLTPIFPEDATRLGATKFPLIERVRSMASADQYFMGGYIRKIRMILRPRDGITSRHPEPMSQVAQGLTILHEGHHARIDIEEKTEIGCEFDIWKEEVVVREKDFAIVSAIGGVGYIALVQEAANKTSIDPVTSEITPGTPDTALNRELWADIVGGNVAPSELEMWHDTVVLDGVWRFCQYNHGLNAYEEFAQFLQNRNERLQLNLK